MFYDYYKILGIDSSATSEEIKKAYHKQSLRWHPDRNLNRDVTDQMQAINEAYAILKDAQKKARYDAEYARFYSCFVKEEGNTQNVPQAPTNSNEYDKETQSQEDSYSYDFEVQDEGLKMDIEEARMYARNLVSDFMKSFKKSTKTAVCQGGKVAIQSFIAYIVAGLILTLVSLFFLLLT